MENIDYEGLQSSSDHSYEAEGMRQVELAFIAVFVNPPRPEDLADRIDEVDDGKTPKAI